MKTLVIHPNDVTTGFLEDIYFGKGYTVIDTIVSNSYLKRAIKEHDRIIMLGHGDEKGVYDINKGSYIIDSSLVYLLREKVCICIWCNADVFVEKYKLNAFYTGMFISEVDEAYYESVRFEDDDITNSNQLFARLVSKYIDDDNILAKLRSDYKVEGNYIIDFNRERLFQIF